MEQKRYCTQSIREVEKLLATDKEQGLSQTEVEKRLQQFGLNRLPEPEKTPLVRLFSRQFMSVMVYILLGAVALSLFLRDYKDAVLIGIVVVVNACIGFFQEYKAEKTLEALKNITSPKARVIRDGQIEEVSTEQLVPGDAVRLEEGDSIPADLRLFETVGMEVNESMLTGESMPAEKDADLLLTKDMPLAEQMNMAFMGTVVVRGQGNGIVVLTGGFTQMGKIAETLVIPLEKPTPLEQNMATLGKYLVMAALVASAIIGIVGFLQDRAIEEMLFTVINLAVAVIPEGLVAVVTVTMAIGVQRMARRNAVVRHMPAVETLGAVNVIASDKTGTLTEGQMVVTDLFVAGKLYSVSGTGINPEGKIYAEDKPVAEFSPKLKLALETMALCNNAVLQRDNGQTWEVVGDPTEVALQVLAHKLGVKKEELEQKWTFMEGLPFDNERKRMSVVYDTASGKRMVFTKGATEAVLSVCTLQTNADIEHIKRVDNDLASRGLRVLGLAAKELSAQDNISPETLEQNMKFIGLVGLLDIPRKEAGQAVAECKQAGIRVIMVTGDHPATAKNIGQQLGIFNPELDRIMTEAEIDRMTEKDFSKLRPFPAIFARVSPENKLTLVKAMRNMGWVVAMTGDGVNDAPAIKHANIGVAMGKGGTDVTMQAADMVLTDDNFATIVTAVKEGRRIFANLQKFIRYFLSCNASTVLGIFFCTVANLPLPFAPVQILWLNMISDTPPALTIGFDQAAKDIMQRRPRNIKKGLFRRADIIFIIYHAAIIVGLMLSVFLLELHFKQASLEKARTMAFAMLVLLQLTQAFIARSTTQSFFSKTLAVNKTLLGAVLFSLTMLLLGIYLPYLNDVFGQIELGLRDWVNLTVGILVLIACSEIFKFFTRKYAFRQP